METTPWVQVKEVVLKFSPRKGSLPIPKYRFQLLQVGIGQIT